MCLLLPINTAGIASLQTYLSSSFEFTKHGILYKSSCCFTSCLPSPPPSLQCPISGGGVEQCPSSQPSTSRHRLPSSLWRKVQKVKETESVQEILRELLQHVQVRSTWNFWKLPDLPLLF